MAQRQMASRTDHLHDCAAVAGVPSLPQTGVGILSGGISWAEYHGSHIRMQFPVAESGIRDYSVDFWPFWNAIILVGIGTV